MPTSNKNAYIFFSVFVTGKYFSFLKYLKKKLRNPYLGTRLIFNFTKQKIQILGTT